jgi:hypothetical protein
MKLSIVRMHAEASPSIDPASANLDKHQLHLTFQPETAMTRRRSLPLPVMDPLGWFKVAAHTVEMMQASAHVISRRSMLMSKPGKSQSAADRREIRGMVQEKYDAAAESASAMAWKTTEISHAAVMDLGQRMATNYARLWGCPMNSAQALLPLKGVRTAAAAITDTGLEPYRRRAIRNAARMRKVPAGK